MRISDWSSDVCSSDLEAVLDGGADVSGGADGVAAVEQRPAQPRHLLPEGGLVHAFPLRRSRALAKKPELPKLPDLSASASGRPPSAKRAGTPGSISGPTVLASRPRAETTAPDVPPPAPTRRRPPPPPRPDTRRGGKGGV